MPMELFYFRGRLKDRKGRIYQNARRGSSVLPCINNVQHLSLPRGIKAVVNATAVNGLRPEIKAIILQHPVKMQTHVHV